MRAWLAGMLLVLVGIVDVAAAPPEPLLWRSEGTTGTVWLLGSFHMLQPTDYPLDARVEAAYTQADRLVFEVDPGEMTDPQTLQAIQKMARFEDGRTLRGVISRRTANRLRRFLGGSEVAMTSADAFKPWYMGLNIAVGSMLTMGLDPKLGLDQHFMQRAQRDDKSVSGLETAVEQIGALDRAPLAEQEYTLVEALGPAAKQRERILQMHALWRAGDAAGLEALVNEDMREHTPRMHELLAGERNQRWLPQVLERTRTPGNTLVVVGSMHLLGDDGLVELLRRKGVRIERVGSVVPPAQLDKAA